MNKIGVLTSGGDAPGMNAAIRTVVRCGIDKGMEILGIERGYEGLINGEIAPMDRNSVSDILQRGGTVLKTARSQLFMTNEGQEKAVSMLDTFDIEGLIVIGGNGSMKGASELAERGIPVMFLPCTIDNDMGYTDYTIGFDTAVTTVLEAITKIRDTSSAHERTTVIEVMGRECGDIAIYSGLTGGASAILIPEVDTDMSELCKNIIIGANRGKRHSIIIKAEGAGISSEELVKEIEKRTGRDTKLVVLSYLQRGGAPTMRDRLLATLCAAKAVDLLAEYSPSRAIGTVNGRIEAFELTQSLEQKNEMNPNIMNLIEVLSR